MSQLFNALLHWEEQSTLHKKIIRKVRALAPKNQVTVKKVVVYTS